MPFDERLWFDNHQRASPIKNRASATIAKRVAGVVLRLFVLRSWNRASCLRRKRLSAMRAARDDQNKRIKVNNFRFYNPLLVLRPDAGELGSYFFADDIDLGR